MSTDPNNRKYQWTGQFMDKEIMMLNTDFEVFFDLKMDSDGRATCDLQVDCDLKRTCGVNGVCPLSKAYPYAVVYSRVSVPFSILQYVRSVAFNSSLLLLIVVLYFTSSFRK